MAHFDFVVADEQQKPLFAVEFDGGGHSTVHDANKDEICRCADLALFRVGMHSSRIEAVQLTFLGYLVHLWFLAAEFKRMQDAGILSDNESFMISGFLRSDAKNIFDSEFDMLGPARGKFNNFCRKNDVPGGPMWHLRIAHVLLVHDEDGFAAFSSFEVESVKVFGRCMIDLKLPHLGALATVAFARHEIGQFCTALALRRLATSKVRFAFMAAWKQVGETRWPLRANPSSGNLHPTEGYACQRRRNTARTPSICLQVPRPLTR